MSVSCRVWHQKYYGRGGETRCEINPEETSQKLVWKKVFHHQTHTIVGTLKTDYVVKKKVLSFQEYETIKEDAPQNTG